MKNKLKYNNKKMNSLNIVELIEKNPITRLSKNYQNMFIEKIKQNFNEEEQRLFVANFYCYLNYKDDEFIVSLNDIWKWIGFKRIDYAKTALTNNFKMDVDYKVEVFLNKQENLKNVGGRPKENILMTIDTFKSFCMTVSTEKAKSIRNYYIKMEKLVTETFQTEMDEIRLQLQEKAIEHINDKKLDKHKLLLKKFKHKTCVYLVELGENLIKIGSAENIEERHNGLKMTFKLSNIYFLDIFESDNFRDIEKIIFQDLSVKNNFYTEKINGHLSREVVRLTHKFTYQNLVHIIETILKNYNNPLNLTHSQLLENKKLDLINKLIDKDYKLDDIKNLLNLELNISNKNNDVIIDNNKNNNYILTNNNIVHRPASRTKPILQLNIHDLSLFKKYTGYSNIFDVNPDYCYPQIARAIKTNKIYKNFRWCFEGDEIQPTVTTKAAPNVEAILELNKDKTEIVNSFATKKELFTYLDIGRVHLDNIISRNLEFKNHYYILYSQCTKVMLDNYKEPINFYTVSNSVKIKQIHPITGEEIIFSSVAILRRKYNISPRTLHEMIKAKEIYKCFLWDYVDNERHNNIDEDNENDEFENDNTDIASSSKDI